MPFRRHLLLGLQPYVHLLAVLGAVTFRMHAAWRDASCAPFFALGFGLSPETGAGPHAMPRVILRRRKKIVLEWLISNGRRYAALGSSETIRRPLRSN
jgi:hypothetical protein